MFYVCLGDIGVRYTWFSWHTSVLRLKKIFLCHLLRACHSAYKTGELIPPWWPNVSRVLSIAAGENTRCRCDTCGRRLTCQLKLIACRHLTWWDDVWRFQVLDPCRVKRSVELLNSWLIKHFLISILAETAQNLLARSPLYVSDENIVGFIFRYRTGVPKTPIFYTALIRNGR